MDLVKAALIGAVLIAGLFAISAVIAALVPILIIFIVVGAVWVIIKIVQDDPKPPP